MYQILQYIYSQLYVEYVSRNPLYRRGPDDSIDDCELFTMKVEEYLRSLNLLRI